MRRAAFHPDKSDRPKYIPGRGVILFILWSLFVTGCRNPGCYHAGSLPPEMMAPPVRSAARIDLSDISLTTPRHDLLYPEDLIDVSVVTGLEDKKPAIYPLRIGRDGTVNVPLVGQVMVKRMTPVEAEQAIASESVRRGVYQNPQVSVSLNSRKTNKITVVGAVEEPQVIELPIANSDLLSAITLAGGLTEKADTIVEIRHPRGAERMAGGVAPASHTAGRLGQRRSVRVDLAEIASADPGQYRLVDGSTVMVMRKDARVLNVIGLVNKPNQLKMPEDHDLRVLDALAMAGGRTLSIADKVKVIRNGKTIQVSVKQAKNNANENIRLAPGDVVSVEETPTTFVVNTLRSFIRVGFSGAIPGF
ncbi:MAG: polysaccharide biosynthesis/export family protein [Planctomycetota bacterium]